MRVRIVLTRGQEFIREQVLEPGLTIVGRDATCDVVIDDIAVSKRHLMLELSEGGCAMEDMGSRNGIRVNGRAAKRQVLKHLDVIEIGSVKMHILDDAMLPQGGLDLESTFHGPDRGAARDPARDSSPLAETQPGTTPAPTGPVYALKRIDEALSDIAPLDQVRTVVGVPGRAALIVRRRDKLLLTKLSRARLNVNGLEVDGASAAVQVGDVIDVGALRYQLVRIG